MILTSQIFYPLTPGAKVPDDWFAGTIPLNIITGEHTVIDSSFCFKHFFSTLPAGLKTGHHVTLWRTTISTEENGLIEIGDYTYIANAALVCYQQITIGRRVLIAGGVTIADADFHPLDPALRIADTIALSPVGHAKNRPPVSAKPVIIEDDVWIGFNATILKGVHIGAGAIISPGAVVIENVAAGATVAGNPAKSVSA